ncbi:prepilin peptidase [Streptomyces sp. NPDC052095]|uniref:prepilin peptidase n=1 Tax=unclassified Streptomyces TaxID=2593676 RepID=UPI00344ECD94
MDAMLTVLAALWGAAAGLLVPRAAYRFSVEPEEPWRDACPAGHPLTGPAGGWLGSTRCATCATSPAAPDHAPAEGPRAESAEDPLTETAEAPAGAPSTGTAGATTDGRPAAATDGPSTGTTGQQTARPAEAPADGPTGQQTEPPTGPPAEGPGETRPHPARYAPGVLVPVVTALSCAALGAATGPRPELAVWLLLAPVAVLLATIDRRVHRLPDRLTLPAAGAAAVLLGLAALLPEHAGSWPTALLGGAALGGFYFLLFLINPNGMGFGDVKLALSLGAVLGWYGWAMVFAGGFAGFLLGAAYGFGLMVLRRAGRKTGIPFGPFMITGALLGILLGALAA